MPETSILEVPRHRFSFDHPWSVPADAKELLLRRSVDGAMPRLPTTVAVYYDDSRLYLIYRGRDDLIKAALTGRDDPIYNEDAVEVFLAPENARQYFEIEVSPIGTIFDARIDNPDGDRRTMRADAGWNCEGLWAALWRDYLEDGGSIFAVTLAIPFAGLDRATPDSGETWRGNFFRVDRSPRGDEYSAWQPTLRNPADFHVPGVFGELVFR